MPKLVCAKCGDDAENIIQKAEVHEEGWQAIKFSGGFIDDEYVWDYDIDPYVEDRYAVDLTELDFECQSCYATSNNINNLVEIIYDDERSNYVTVQRYICEYCAWTGNFPEDHPESCPHRGITGPLSETKIKQYEREINA